MTHGDLTTGDLGISADRTPTGWLPSLDARLRHDNLFVVVAPKLLEAIFDRRQNPLRRGRRTKQDARGAAYDSSRATRGRRPARGDPGACLAGHLSRRHGGASGHAMGEHDLQALSSQGAIDAHTRSPHLCRVRPRLGPAAQAPGRRWPADVDHRRLRIPPAVPARHSFYLDRRPGRCVSPEIARSGDKWSTVGRGFPTQLSRPPTSEECCRARADAPP